MSRPTTMKVDGTVYWAIFTYTDAGVLVDADSTPTVAVRKNGASTADAVTVTKRAATTGIYDCTHAPSGEVEGDCFAYEETATLSAQAYLNSWELEVFAVERGTDSALLAADKPANFDLLVVNGSGEVTTSNPASGGGSAHTAADVAALILRTPTTPLTNDATGALGHVLLADVTTTNTDMRGTDSANTVAPDNASIAAILVDTADLQANQGQWLTATGFNTIAPDNASIAAILVDTADLQANQGQWLTATGFNTVAPDNAGITANGVAVAALNDPTAAAIADAVWDESQAGHVIAGSFGEYLDAKVSLAGGGSLTVTDIVNGVWDEAQSSHVTVGSFGYYIDGQVSTAGSGGTGLYQSTVRIEDASNNSLQGARVNVDGTTLTLTTGTSGEVTFNLDNGVYLLEVSPPAGYGTPVGQVLTVSGADPADTTFTLSDGCGTVPWIG